MRNHVTQFVIPSSYHFPIFAQVFFFLVGLCFLSFDSILCQELTFLVLLLSSPNWVISHVNLQISTLIFLRVFTSTKSDLLFIWLLAPNQKLQGEDISPALYSQDLSLNRHLDLHNPINSLKTVNAAYSSLQSEYLAEYLAHRCLLNNRINLWSTVADNPFTNFLPVPFCGICFMARIRFRKLRLASVFFFHKPLSLKVTLDTYFVQTEFL